MDYEHSDKFAKRNELVRKSHIFEAVKYNLILRIFKETMF